MSSSSIRLAILRALRHHRYMPETGSALLGRWRTGIRLSETALVIGLWAAGLTASDPVIAQLLLAVGFLIGALAIFADPSQTAPKKVHLFLLLALVFGSFEAVFVWRSQADRAASKAPSPQTVIREIDRYFPAAVPSAPSSPSTKIDPYQSQLRISLPNITRKPQLQEPSPPLQTKSEPNPEMAEAEDYLKKTEEKMRRQSIAWKVSEPCMLNKETIERGLVNLINEAVDYQNQFFKYNDKKQINGDYKVWLGESQAYLSKNKSNLPDTTIFDLAYEYGGSNSGKNTWALMDAKRKALESIRKAVDTTPCDALGEAAVTECENSGSCQATQQDAENLSQSPLDTESKKQP